MSLPNHFTPVRLALPIGHDPGKNARPNPIAKIVRVALCLALAIACLCPPVQARQQSSGGVTSAKATAQLLDDLLNDLDDIAVLRGLNPLKLTPEQIDRIIGAVSSAKQAYDTKLRALVSERVDKMAEEIRSVKRKMLSGAPIPADFFERVKQASADFVARRDKLNMQNIVTLSSALREILTPEQIASSADFERKAPAHASNKGGGSDEQWFNLYVAEEIIGYPRIVPLLKEMRGAFTNAPEQSGGTQSAGNQGAGGGR